MGQDPEELKREIEQTRGDMGETLDAIGDRISPSRMAQRKKNRMMQGVHAARDRVMGTAEHAEHRLEQGMDDMKQRAQGAPLVAGGLMFGMGFLAAVIFPSTREERELARKAMTAAEPAKEQLVESAKDVAQQLQEPAREAAENVKEAAREGMTSVKESAPQGN
jgi:hypothetical protein